MVIPLRKRFGGHRVDNLLSIHCPKNSLTAGLSPCSVQDGTHWVLYFIPLAVSDGLMGMAIVGGAALALGGLVGLGVAALKKK